MEYGQSEDLYIKNHLKKDIISGGENESKKGYK